VNIVEHHCFYRHDGIIKPARRSDAKLHQPISTTRRRRKTAVLINNMAVDCIPAEPEKLRNVAPARFCPTAGAVARTILAVLLTVACFRS